MRLQRYFPTVVGQQIVWLRNFSSKLPTHAEVLTLEATVMAARLLDVANAIHALASYRGALAAFAAGAYRRIEDALHNAEVTGTVAWLAFAPPPDAPAPVAYGCLDRVFAYIADVIRKSPGCDAAISASLGIDIPATTAPDVLAVPDFKLRFTTGGKLEVVWAKLQFDGVKLEFDLGAAGRRSDMDLRPNYTLDWLPPAGQAVVIRVRLRSIYKGEDFGNWSEWRDWTLTGE